ncbi:RimK/LysX family protein [Marinicella sp. S1101]|uniref:ATP-dependent zinc protease family protein n=1 Tax=Marinicella marina TaxID=2996016 RepID=UPI00226100F9|nr:RimK/LysX family protein [Marinicella marina]MCX7554048.1 RimK/LysX family protein [Marinicella marina]MDJ1140540.1 RimK/LysX family protein [Marinicella marina]
MKQKILKVGWKEYAALPALGIDRIHVKIDTGAKTSAIHAVKHRLFKKGQQHWVRVHLAPYQDDDDTIVICELPVKDQRTVTSSNGHQSERVVVETQFVIGGVERTIELTLSFRDTMKFRMLLGRQAMKDMAVIPSESHLTTKQKPRKKQ